MIKLIVIDVDGTLTDGGIIYDSAGVETKRFHAADGLGIVMAIAAGIKVAVLSGRISEAVRRRMAELGVVDIVEGSGNKAEKMLALREKYRVDKEESAFIGDDINDLPAFDESGLCIAVEDAAEPLLKRADFVTARRGGHGAVREAIDTILKRQGMLDEAIEQYLTHVAAKAGPSN